MTDLHKALDDISSIRRQMAHSTQFRGYGPATLAATGVIAFLAALSQSIWLPDPANHVPVYLSIWISTAVLSAALTGVQMYTRTRRIHSGLSDEMIRMAVEQFLPAVGAGLLSAGIRPPHQSADPHFFPGARSCHRPALRPGSRAAPIKARSLTRFAFAHAKPRLSACQASLERSHRRTGRAHSSAYGDRRHCHPQLSSAYAASSWL